MNKIPLFLLILVIVAGCQSTGATPTPDAPQSPPTTETNPSPTPIPPTPTSQPDAYPYPAEPIPTPLPEDYPAPPVLSPTIDPYPSGEFIWILQAVGKQCEDGKSYNDLQSAVTALGTAGVAVKSSEMTDLVVCTACGCPTSSHYRVQIDAANLETAVSLGWVEE